MAHGAMLFANMVWGGMSPIVKGVLLTGAITPIALSAMRIAGGAILFIILSFILPSSIAPKEKIEPKDRWKILMMSILMISMNQGLYILGLGFTTPIDSSVMSTLTPVFTMICAAIFIAQPITGLKVVGVVTGLSGALILAFSGSHGTSTASNPMLGDAMCLGAQLCAALYYVLFKDIITRYAPFTLMKWMFICSTVTYVLPCSGYVAEVQWKMLTMSDYLSLAYIITLATFISYLLIPFAQQNLRPTVVSMYTYFQPITAALLAAIMGLAEFGIVKILATLLIFVGVWFVTRSKGTDPTPMKKE
jgi:drug/metabolite transporter (DMT)-like permease